MAKSLSFSFDMDKLYRVNDSGKLNSFDLSGHGVNLKFDSNNKLHVSKATSTPSGMGAILSTIDNVWQPTFHDGTSSIYIIGIDDILTAGKTAKEFTFDISGNNVLNIRRDGTNLVCVLS